MRACAIAVAVCVGAGGCARTRAGAPEVVVPTRQPRGAATSSAPPGHGEVELGIGAVTTAVAAALVGVGSYEAWHAGWLRSYCSQPAAIDDTSHEATCVGPFGGNPAVTATVSSVLSLTFAVPIAVGGALLLRRGVTLRRAWLKEQAAGKMSLRPWSIGQHGAGLSFGLAF